MQIFYAKSHKSDGSAAVRRLLQYAYRKIYGESMPDIAKTDNGKPFFPSNPDVFFSLSHTNGYIMCAVGEYDIGVDIQKITPVKDGFPLRICTREELEMLDFFSLWTLKESAIKLLGKSPDSYKSLAFSANNGQISCFDGKIMGKIYTDIPGFAAAACSFGENLPECLQFVPAEFLCADT